MTEKTTNNIFYPLNEKNNSAKTPESERKKTDNDILSLNSELANNEKQDNRLKSDYERIYSTMFDSTQFFHKEQRRLVIKNFYVFEGIDGSGTTTQLKLLSKALKAKGIDVFETAEPTTTETGKFLRKILKGEIETPESTRAYLFAADRDNHLYGTGGILEQINSGKTVLSDRYLFSSLAYQCTALPFETVYMLNSLFPMPEVIIYIDLPVNISIERVNSRGEEKEIYEQADIQRKVREGYKKALSNLPKECKLIKIDGTKPIEKVSADILNAISI